MTSFILLGMSVARFSKTLGSKVSHTDFACLISFSFDVQGGRLLHLSFMMPHIFSIGFKSRLFPGHWSFSQKPGRCSELHL
uniref:Uncharacterized protein n=1 Tax=Lepeophtheirus salmonis TaxID=72036 RepID=A0A0K2TQV4_LEPSM